MLLNCKPPTAQLIGKSLRAPGVRLPLRAPKALPQSTVNVYYLFRIELKKISLWDPEELNVFMVGYILISKTVGFLAYINQSSSFVRFYGGWHINQSYCISINHTAQTITCYKVAMPVFT